MIGLLVCAFTYTLRAVDFGPLRALVSFEDRLYDILAPPTLELIDAAHPIVFIDIDDDAMHRWGAPQRGVIGTPRAMIAELTRAVRAARASVVFVDFDVRNPLQDNSALMEELSKPSAARVLLPTFFGSGVLPRCVASSDDNEPIELPMAFADAIGTGSVDLVHPLVTLGSYGLIDGVCSFYRVRVGENAEIVSRKAAMLHAVELSGNAGNMVGAQLDHAVQPHVIPIRWWVRNDTELLHDKTGKLAYAHIKASLYARKSAIDLTGTDQTIFEKSIVIIGPTHIWADDTHATTAGDLPGGIVHANLGIELQALPVVAMPLYIQFGLDAFLLISAAIVAVPLCWHPVYKACPLGARLPARMRILRLLRETAIIIIFGALFTLMVLFIAGRGIHFLEGWRFGLLSFIICAAVVLLIELFNMAADSAGEVGETIATRLSSYFTKSNSVSPAASHSPGEEETP